MARKILVILVSAATFFLTFNSVRAEELPLQPYLYTQDFEGEDPVKVWGSGGNSTINFQGLTEEKAFSGKKSAKFDVTFQGGASFVYRYWKIPLGKVPVEGELKMTARVFVGEETTPKKAGDARLGISGRCYHGNINGLFFKSCGPPTGEWKLLEMDLVELAKQDVNSKMKKYLWGATADNTGFYITRIGFSLHGGKGKRVVLYVDDIKIEGKVPVEKDLRKAAKKRWAPVKKKIDEKIMSWEKETAMMQKKIESFSNLSPEAETMKKEAKERLFSLKKSIKQEKNRGYIKPAQVKSIEISITQLKSIISNIEAAAGEGGMVSLKDVLCYVVSNPTTSSEKILPNSTISEPISDTISIIACRGEYEPASFVIHPLRDITFLEITPTDLKGKAGVIPSKNVDIKVVKCWYDKDRGGSGKRVLVPDLLLNDDTLVRVNYEEEENYLKLSYPEGQKYVWISKHGKRNSEENIKFELRHGSYKIFRTEDYPVRDSSSLLQVDIPAKTNKQFWVTLNVPEDAEPGVYKGKINLCTSKESLGSINLRLRVLPFELSKPYYTSSIYYRGVLHQDYPKGSISAELKSKKQLKAELRNMYIHGVTNPLVYQPLNKDGKELKEVLEIRKKIGMKGPLYACYVQHLGNKAHESLRSKLKQVIDIAKSFGIEEVYFYGRDEATEEKLARQRPCWEMVHEVGGKVFVAGYTAKRHPPGNFAVMGDIQDLLVCAGPPTREESEKWHSVGHKIWCYAYPHSGFKKSPSIFRKNYGLLLWQTDYDGAGNYAYQSGLGKIWSPFDGNALNFTFPTVNGIVDTIAWEGYREGVDDVRYLTTLLNAIEQGKESKDKEIRQTALSAEEYLGKLKESSLLAENLGNIRLEMIKYILRLTGGK